MTYEGDLASIQWSLAQTHDLVIRRIATLEALNLRVGERVLELGCGGGFYAAEAAKFVGPSGFVAAIDVSEDQVAAAREQCAEFEWAECQVADATDLPYEDGYFDAVFAVQVIEYIPDLDRALSEVRRVLRTGGRLIVLSTNWNSMIWHSQNPERMSRVLDAWATHAPYQDLPAILPARLRNAGLELLHQEPVPVLNNSYHQHSFSYWGARLIHAFVVSNEVLSKAEANAWLNEFDELEQEGAYFFCSTPVLTEAMRIA